jgi:hypothetical protein
MVNFLHIAEQIIKNAVLLNGHNDGVCDILEIGMDDCVDIHGCTDILSAYVSPMGGLTFLVSDHEDKTQYFVGIEELPSEIAVEIAQKVAILE